MKNCTIQKKKVPQYKREIYNTLKKKEDKKLKRKATK
jgi:hypothetical protein